MQAMVAEGCFLKKGEDRFPGAVVRETEAVAPSLGPVASVSDSILSPDFCRGIGLRNDDPKRIGG